MALPNETTTNGYASVPLNTTYVPDVPLDTPTTYPTAAYVPSAHVSMAALPSVPAPSNPAPVPTATTTNTATNSTTSSYEQYKVVPSPAWPPPVFIKLNASPEERYYIENRWYGQWRFFDKKADENKKGYFRGQRVIVIGSVTVPVLISIGPSLASYAAVAGVEGAVRATLDIVTVLLSLAVAVAAGWESMNKYAEYWASYRQAAEDLQTEKHIYDISAGRYSGISNPFSRFVERCEEIMAQQNGRFMQTVERQQQQSEQTAQQVMEKYSPDKQPETAQWISTPDTVQNTFAAGNLGNGSAPVATNGTYSIPAVITGLTTVAADISTAVPVEEDSAG